MENMSALSAEERIRYNKEHAVEPETYLMERGLVEETDDETELRLTPRFADRLRKHIDTVSEQGVAESDMAKIFNVDDEDVTELDRDYAAYKIIFIIRKWPSEAAVVFDVATDRALRESTDWAEAVPPRQKHRILQSLRAFQDACFFCDGQVAYSEEPRQSCCSERNVVTVHCENCSRRFLEFALEGQDPDPEVRVST